jgi:hypothetical protein
MEIAKFVLTAVGTFISVSGLTFTIFQFWAKRRDEKDSAFRASIAKELEAERMLSRQEITDERAGRKEGVKHLELRIEKLEKIVTESLVSRMGNIEGELKGMRATLQKIQDWFIQNTVKGG